MKQFPDFRLPCPILPTIKEFVATGDWTRRFGMEHSSVHTGGRFHCKMELYMKLGMPKRGQDPEQLDEQRPERFAEHMTNVLHPYLVELARGRYVIHGGDKKDYVALELKSRSNEPPVRCFMLKYDDLREGDRTNRSFIRHLIPTYLMDQAMALRGTFEHDCKERWMFQAVGDGEQYEELFIGRKPDVEEIDVTKRVAIVSRPAILIVLQNNFYERFARVESFWHDSVVVPLMYGNANVTGFKPGTRRDRLQPVDVTGLAPRDLYGKYRGKMTRLAENKIGIGTLTSMLADESKPANEAAAETPAAAPTAEATGSAEPSGD